MILPRLLTSLIGIPLLLFVIHWGGLSYSVFVAAIAALSLYEYSLILFLGRRPVQQVIVILGGTALSLALALHAPVVPVLFCVVAAAILRELVRIHHSLDRAALTIMGAVVLGLMPAHLALIRNIRPHGESLTYLFFAAVWASETAAYGVGTAFGRHKLAPVISPKKTWEGAIAGFAAAVLAVWAFRAWRPETLSRSQTVAVGIVIGLVGQFSDLSESLIKRSGGVKDSGALLPGHGGIMDRFDSFLLSAPAVYCALVLLPGPEGPGT